MRIIHVMPQNDERMHAESEDCPCGPLVETVDPETLEAFDGKRIIHNAFDHREAVEELLGETLGPDKKWVVLLIDGAAEEDGAA